MSCNLPMVSVSCAKNSSKGCHQGELYLKLEQFHLDRVGQQVLLLEQFHLHISLLVSHLKFQVVRGAPLNVSHSSFK